MKDKGKTKEQLINELGALRQQINELKKSESERKRMEEQLKESEEKYKDIVELAPDGIITTDLKGKITSCNTALAKRTGFPKEKFINRHFSKIPTVRAKDIPKYLKALNSLLRGKTPKPFEFEWIHKDGTTHTGEMHTSLIKRAGRIKGILTITRDITGRTRVEKALQESERRFKDLWNNAPVAYHTLDTKGTIISANQTEAKMLGYQPKEMIGKPIFNFILAEQRAEARKRFRQKISGKHIPRAESRTYVKKDGSKLYVVIDDVLERDSKSKIIGIRTTMVDITESKQAEEKLKESEEKFKSLAEQSPHMVFINKKGRVVYANKKCEETTGYKKEEFYSPDFSFLRLIAPESRKITKSSFAKHMKGKEVKPYEHTLISKDGKRIETIHASKLIDYEGEKAILGIETDITYRKRAEEKLRESEERYRGVVENAHDAIYVITPDGFKYVNPAFEELTGYASKEIYSKEFNFWDIIHPDDIKLIKEREAARKRAEEVPSRYEFRIISKDGKIKTIEPATVDIGEKGEAKVMGILRDITERKQSEEEKEILQAQLIQAEKLAGVGTLAGGIAHEFNNLLQIMSGHVQLAQKTKKTEDVEDAFQIVLNTSDRAAKIIKDLLAFSRTEVSEKQLFNVTDPIESVLSLTEDHLKKHNIRVVRNYVKSPRIEANKEEMKQVFLNIVTNARDGMLPKGGKLEICIKKIKGNVEVSFSDTGKGIEKENLIKVFEPFYTTKGAVGGDSILQGTGLGLSVSYGIVKRHAGTIEVKSKVGKGTTFTVKLPVEGLEAKGKIQKRRKKKEVKKKKSMNILVVDDEEEICKMIKKWLFAEGHQVIIALTGRKAINLAKKEHFDVVFLDIVMPGVSATDVLENIKDASSRTKVVMITGRLIDNSLLNELRKKGASDFLQKPFKLEDIMKTIKRPG